jgi:glycosyltransferase involved in cell wall biosynthesis
VVGLRPTGGPGGRPDRFVTAVPLVSICIPTYNGERFLRPCLDSALQQTVRDIEIVVVDDASSDATVAIAESYAARDPRVVVVRNDTNAGLVGNWNRSIGHARGRWIKLLFQDDLLHPDFLATTLAHAERHGCALLASLRNFAFHDGADAGCRNWYEDHRQSVARLTAARTLAPDDIIGFALDMMGFNFLGEPSVTLIERSVFAKVGTFDPALSQRCDTEFWIRAGLHFGLNMVHEDLATFRVHADSTSTRNNATRLYADQWLDRIVILHHYLFDPLYESLRRVARRQRRHRALTRKFWDMCHDASVLARETRGAEGTRMRADLHNVASRYPRITSKTLTRTLGRKIRRGSARLAPPPRNRGEAAG